MKLKETDTKWQWGITHQQEWNSDFTWKMFINEKPLHRLFSAVTRVNKTSEIESCLSVQDQVEVGRIGKDIILIISLYFRNCSKAWNDVFSIQTSKERVQCFHTGKTLSLSKKKKSIYLFINSKQTISSWKSMTWLLTLLLCRHVLIGMPGRHDITIHNTSLSRETLLLFKRNLS